ASQACKSAALTTMRPFPTTTPAPSDDSTRPIVSTSSSGGASRMRFSPSAARMDAARIGSTAFFAPLIFTLPVSGRPPRITSLFMEAPPLVPVILIVRHPARSYSAVRSPGSGRPAAKALPGPSSGSRRQGRMHPAKATAKAAPASKQEPDLRRPLQIVQKKLRRLMPEGDGKEQEEQPGRPAGGVLQELVQLQ